MPTYIVLASFTDKGAHDVKDTVGRSDKFKDMAKKAGVTVKDMYWTLGSTDVVAICDAPDDASATVLSMSVSSRGYVRTQTLRAFTAAEMGKILERLN
jgi:uncharacterized protein with GYD domain